MLVRPAEEPGRLGIAGGEFTWGGDEVAQDVQRLGLDIGRRRLDPDVGG